MPASVIPAKAGIQTEPIPVIPAKACPITPYEAGVQEEPESVIPAKAGIQEESLGNSRTHRVVLPQSSSSSSDICCRRYICA